MNVIIITGASSGIGMEFALQMDNYFTNIDEFWLVARSRPKLEEVAGVMEHTTRIFAMDVTDDSELNNLTHTLQEEKACVRMLINCAGYGVMGAFATQNRTDALGMVRLNCEALTNVTHRVLPFMRKGSRIIQLASSAAFLPQANFAVYAATKSYVLSFSRALGEELRERSIYVTAVCPGPVDTPFFDIAEKNGSTLAIKKYTMVTPEEVVEQALRDSYFKLPLSVCSLPIQSFFALSKWVPHDMLLKGATLMKKLENSCDIKVVKMGSGK